MWIFTDVADWFDKTRADNDAWIDHNLQPWVASTLYDDSPWYRNVGVWTASGTLYALNKFTTTVASGFVDVLRLGDGVREGGWGYGKDALRLLMVLGPAARGARYFASLIPAVDISPAVGNCSWVAATRLLRLTGSTKPWVQLGDVARWMGLAADETGGIWPKDLLPALRHLGASAEEAEVASMGDLAKTVAKNPNGATMFSVHWNMAGDDVGHTLIAVRDAFGGMTIIDRSGRAVKALADLGDLYPSIGTATVDSTVVVVQNSAVVKSLGTVPMLMEIATQAGFSSSSRDQPNGNPDGQSGNGSSGRQPSPQGATPSNAGGQGQSGGGSTPSNAGGQGQSGAASSGQVVWLSRVTGLVYIALDPSLPQTPMDILKAIKPYAPDANLPQVMTSLQELMTRGAAKTAGGAYTSVPGFQTAFGQPKSR